MTDEELAWAMTSEPAKLIQRLAVWVSRSGASDDESETSAVEACKALANALASLCREGLRQGPELRRRLREAAASEASRIRARRLRHELAGTSAALRAGLGIDDAASDSSEESMGGSRGRAGSPARGDVSAVAAQDAGFEALGGEQDYLGGIGAGAAQFGGWLGDGPGVVLTGVGGGAGEDCAARGRGGDALQRPDHWGDPLADGLPAAEQGASGLAEAQAGCGAAAVARDSWLGRGGDAAAASAWRDAAATACRALAATTACPSTGKGSSPLPCTAAPLPPPGRGAAASPRDSASAADASRAGRTPPPRPDRPAALAGMAGAVLRLPFGHCLLAAAAPPLLVAIDSVAASAAALHRGAQGPCCCGRTCRCQPARAALRLAERLACVCASEASTAAGGCDEEDGAAGMEDPDAARRRATASWAERAPAFVQEVTGVPAGSGGRAVSAAGAASAKDVIRAILPRLAAAATAAAPAPVHDSSSPAGPAAGAVESGPGHCPLCHQASLCDAAGLGILAAVRRWPTALDMAAARWPRRTAGALLATLAGSAAALTAPQAPFEAFPAPPTPGVPAGAVALRLAGRGLVADVWHSRVLIALLALGQVVAEDGPVPNTRWLRRAAEALAPLDPASLAALAMEVASSDPHRDPRSSGRFALAVEGAAVDCLWRVRRRVLACAADEDDEARVGGDGAGGQPKAAAPTPTSLREREAPTAAAGDRAGRLAVRQAERAGSDSVASSGAGAGADAPPVPEPLTVSGPQGAEQAVMEAGTVLFPLAYPVWWQLLRVLATRWPAHPSARQARETLSELALLLPPDRDEESRLARWAAGREGVQSSALSVAGRRDGPCGGCVAPSRRKVASSASGRALAPPPTRPQDIWLAVWTEAARRHASSAAMVAALAQALGAAVGAGLAAPAADAAWAEPVPAADPTAEAVRVLLAAAAASSASSPFATYAAATAVRSLADLAGDAAPGPVVARSRRAPVAPPPKGAVGPAGARSRRGPATLLRLPAHGASAVIRALQQPEAVWTLCRSIRGALLHSMAAVRHAISVHHRFPGPMWEGRATGVHRAMGAAERAARTGSVAAAAAAGLLLLPASSAGSGEQGAALGLAAAAAAPTRGASAPDLSDEVAAALLSSADGLAAVLPVAARLRACSRMQLAAAAATGHGLDGPTQVLGQAATHALGALVWSAVSGRAGRRVLERAAKAGPGSASWAAAARTLSSVAEFVVPRASLASIAEPPFRQLLNAVAASAQDASWSSLLLAAAPPPSVAIRSSHGEAADGGKAEGQTTDAAADAEGADAPATAWSSPAAPMWAAWVVEAEGAMALARLPWQWAASSAARAAFEGAASATPPAAASRRKGLRHRAAAKQRPSSSASDANDGPAGSLAEAGSGGDVASLFIAAGWNTALKVTAADASLADEWAGTAARSWAQRVCCDCNRQQTAALALTRPSLGVVGDLVEETAPEVRRAALRLVAVTRRAVKCGGDPAAHSAATAEARWALYRPPPVFLLPRFCCLPACCRPGSSDQARGSFVVQSAQAQCPAACRAASSPQRLLVVLLVILAGLLFAAFAVGEKPAVAAAAAP